MHDGRSEEYGALTTVTHARLRAAQGDVRGARAMLRRLLVERPDDAAARDLLERLEESAHRPGRVERLESVPEPAAAGATDLKDRFARVLDAGVRTARRKRTIRRLRAWLDRARDATGESDA